MFEKSHMHNAVDPMLWSRTSVESIVSNDSPKCDEGGNPSWTRQLFQVGKTLQVMGPRQDVKKLWTQNTVEIYRICCFRRVGLCLSVIMEQHFDIVCIWQNRRKGETKPVSRFLPRTPHPLEHVSGIWFVRLLSPRTCVPCNSMRSMDRLAITSQEDQATAV
jgi:hypothetical protein